MLPPSVSRSGRVSGPKLETIAAATEAGRAALGGNVRLGRRQRRALERLAGERSEAVELSSRTLDADDGVDLRTLERLEARGLVSLRREQRLRRPRVVEVGAPSTRPSLSAEQGAALHAVIAAMDGTSRL